MLALSLKESTKSNNMNNSSWNSNKISTYVLTLVPAQWQQLSFATEPNGSPVVGWSRLKSPYSGQPGKGSYCSYHSHPSPSTSFHPGVLPVHFPAVADVALVDNRVVVEVLVDGAVVLNDSLLMGVVFSTEVSL